MQNNKQIKEIKQIVSLNQAMEAIHEEDGRAFGRVIVAVALVQYMDESQGIELMEVAENMNILPIRKETAKSLVIFKKYDTEDFIDMMETGEEQDNDGN